MSSVREQRIEMMKLRNSNAQDVFTGQPLTGSALDEWKTYQKKENETHIERDIVAYENQPHTD